MWALAIFIIVVQRNRNAGAITAIRVLLVHSIILGIEHLDGVVGTVLVVEMINHRDKMKVG